MGRVSKFPCNPQGVSEKIQDKVKEKSANIKDLRNKLNETKKQLRQHVSKFKGSSLSLKFKQVQAIGNKVKREKEMGALLERC
jgi:very-short-patch-repair endonuclease